MVRILFYIDTLSGGGAEKVLQNLVNHMDQTRFDITVQTMDECDPKKYLAEGIRYKAVNRCKTKLGKKLFSYWFRLCAELKLAYRFFVKDDYDIEAAYLECGATKVIAQSTNKRALKIAWVHCDMSKKEGIGENREKLIGQYRKFDRIMCVSQGVQTEFEKVFGKSFPTKVLYNVIDEDEILSKAEAQAEWNRNKDKTQLLAVGRMSKEKNFARLLDTCGRLRDAGYQFQLSILGEGPERENLERQIQELQLADVVKLKGFCANPYPYMKQADMIVCSSLYEGLSTIVQEALILGKPIVTTPCTGMRELLGDSEFGLISEDSEDGLYNSIRKMMDSTELERDYAAAAKKRGADFSKEKLVKETENFLLQELTRSRT